MTAGSFIFKQGDVSDSMYFLAKGNVRMLRSMPVPEHVAQMMQQVRSVHTLTLECSDPYMQPWEVRSTE